MKPFPVFRDVVNIIGHMVKHDPQLTACTLIKAYDTGSKIDIGSTFKEVASSYVIYAFPLPPV